jgi:ATP-dependent Lhr-like helicase
MMLMEHSELPVFEKYDDCIPPELLRRAYAVDRLRSDEVTARIMEWEREALI